MTAAALPVSLAHAVDRASPAASAPHWPLLGTILVVGLAFFLSEHDVNISLAEDYTQNAEEMEITAAGGNTLRRVAFLVIAGWGLVLLATGRERLRVDPLLAASVILFLAWAGMSFLWADDPGMCLRRLLVLGCCVVAAAGIARRLNLRDVCWLALGTMGALAVVGVLAELRLGTFRPWSAEYRFAGTLHPNMQGSALAAVCVATLGLDRGVGRGRIWLWALAAIAFVLLLLTKSRTATAAMLVAGGGVLLVQAPLRIKIAGGLGLAWLAGAGLWLLFVCGYDPLTDFRDTVLLGRAAESDTLTGRAFIWPEVTYFIGLRPWLGYGYESFWTPARIETISSSVGWGLREAHNAYLEILLSLGVVGLALILVVAGTGLLAAIRGYGNQREAAYTLPIGLLVFGLINAGLESGMVAIELITFILGCCLLRMALFRESRGTP